MLTADEGKALFRVGFCSEVVDGAVRRASVEPLDLVATKAGSNVAMAGM